MKAPNREHSPHIMANRKCKRLTLKTPPLSR